MTRYELLDRIGVGGMAEIFRGKAVAAGGFEKPVAIKRILPHLSQDKRFVELLIAEAKVLSLLKHRNIVQIFDVGLGDDGQYFLVMEYVDGRDLGAVQRTLEAERRRIPFDLALHIGAEICEALEHAHAARAPDGRPMSLVHRDVSPSNVLLSRAGEIKLTDFGIAKRAESEQTGHGAVRGKFAYISPEQARNQHVEPRSDVFSVAVLIWELVTGQRLFSQLGDLEALRAVREAQARRPSEADARIDPRIDALLMPALARDTKRRPTAGQLAEQLRSLRYSLDTTVGDPATELAKIIDNTDEAERLSVVMVHTNANPFDAEHTGATVIRIHTADAFEADIAVARSVIDRFEEEETRLAQLTGDQLQMLRSMPSARDASQRRTTPGQVDDLDGNTVAQAPLDSFDVEESTRIVAPAVRPPPERAKPRVTSSPPAVNANTRARATTAPPAPSSSSRVPVAGPSSERRAPHPPPPGTSRANAPTQPPPLQFMEQLQPPEMPMQPIPQPPQPPIQPLPHPPVAQQVVQPLPPPYPWAMPQEQVYPQHHQPPHRAGLQPWMLVVGALVMALLAFAVTRAFISS
ncbi:MAG: protein kinase [Kofleriaceae bacterium]|nr:protein kinase [Kofleriaceae bacterium]